MRYIFWGLIMFSCNSNNYKLIKIDDYLSIRLKNYWIRTNDSNDYRYYNTEGKTNIEDSVNNSQINIQKFDTTKGILRASLNADYKNALKIDSDLIFYSKASYFKIISCTKSNIELDSFLLVKYQFGSNDKDLHFGANIFIKTKSYESYEMEIINTSQNFEEVNLELSEIVKSIKFKGQNIKL